MYKYDEKNDILVISKIPVAEPDCVYEESEMYKSYKDYLDNKIIDDIDEYLIKPLNEAVIKGTALGGERIWLVRKDKDGKPLCRVRQDNTNFQGYQTMSVQISLGHYWFQNGATPFTLLTIPYMDRYGVLYKENSRLAVIGSLVQDDDITYDKEELKVVTAGGNYYNIQAKSKDLYMKFGRTTYEAARVLAALAVRDKLYEGGDLSKPIPEKFESGHWKLSDEDLRSIDELLETASHISKINGLDTKEARMERIEYAYDSLRQDKLLDRLADKKYSLHKVRSKLNQTLSLYRAEGRCLANKVNLVRQAKTLEPGTILTNSMVRECIACGVCRLTVDNIPSLNGVFLAQNIQLNIIRKGTLLVPEIADYFPENKGKYKNTNWISPAPEKSVYILKGTRLYSDLVEVLQYNGVPDIDIAYSENKLNEPIKIRFTEDIISNRSASVDEVDVYEDTRDGYVYFNEDGSPDYANRDILTAYDLLAMISLYDRLSKGLDLKYIASKDIGLRKKVEMIGDVFGKAMRAAGSKMVKIVGTSMKNIVLSESQYYSPADLDNVSAMENMFWSFSNLFWKEVYRQKVIQQVDRTNPLAFYSSLNKINTITKNVHDIADSMRYLSIGHFGRLCPYEIPSGKKLGVVNCKTPFCRIINGVMYTPYRKVVHTGKRSFLSDEITYLSVVEEEKYRIADIVSIKLGDRNEIINEDRVLARIPANGSLEKVTISYVESAYLDYVTVDPQQLISLACSIIPFMGADDSARVTFEISMSKQAKACVYAEPPIVLTSAYKNVPRQTPYFMIVAEHDGMVIEVSNTSVVVRYDGFDDETQYTFESNEFSNTSIIIRRVLVNKGDVFSAGDILVDSNYVVDGLLAMGVNALVCYVPEGYNYEDGVYASERLKHRLCSYGVNSEVETIFEDYRSVIVQPKNKFKYIQQGDAIYLKQCRKSMSNIIKHVTYANKLHGFIMDAKTSTDDYNQKNREITTKAISFDSMDEGDKIANRHGNKGVVPALRENSQMPRLLNGEFFDIVYNPAGVSSRMNIGQIKECNLGLVGYILRCKLQSDSFNGASNEEIAELLEFTWRLANEDDIDAVVKDYPQFPQEWVQKRLEGIEWIKAWKGAFNKDGTAWVLNPRTGKLFEEPVLIGINYIHKLIHEVKKKINARAGYLTERYKKKGADPTHGAANGGGQRMGEMEIAALSAYGCSAYLQELFNERGDNAVARSNFTADYVFPESDALRVPEDIAIRRSTEEFRYKLEALGVAIEFDSELPNTSIDENSERKVYGRSAFLKGISQEAVVDTDVNSFLKKAGIVDE